MRKIICTAIVAVVTIVAPAQTISKINDMTFGGVNNDGAIFTFRDTLGDIFVFGNINTNTYTTSSPPYDLSVQYGGSDYSVIEYDKNGNKLWSNAYGGSQNDILYKVIPRSSSFLLIGISWSGNDGNKTITASCTNPYPGALINSSRSVWIVEIDFSGNIINQNQVCTDVSFGSSYSNTQIEQITDFKLLSTNQYIIYGNFSSYAGPDGTNYFLQNFIGYMRLDTSFNYVTAIPILGSLQTAVPGQYISYTTIYNGTAGKVLELPNGNIIFSYTLEQTYNRAGCGDNSTNVFSYARTVLFSALDVNQGTQSYGSDYGYSQAAKMIYYNNYVYLFMQHVPLPTNTVNYYGTCSGGAFYIRTAPARTLSGQMDCWIVKLSTANIPVADYAFGANASVTVADVIMDGTNFILGTNVNSGVGFDKTTAGIGGQDYWILSIDPATMTRSVDYCYGGSKDDLLSDVELYNSVLLLSGSSFSNASGNKTANNINTTAVTTDQWTVILCQNPPPPSVPDVGSFNLLLCCKNALATVNVQNPIPGYSYNWYNSATGPAFFTGTSYTTSTNVLSTTALYVDQNNGYCGSTRFGFNLYPIPSPKSPIISGDTVVCKGKTLTLIAQTDTAGMSGVTGITRWYDSTSTKIIHTGDTLSVPNFKSNQTFYVSTIDSVYAPSLNLGPIICESRREIKTASFDTAAIPAMTQPAFYCYGTSPTLSLTNQLPGSIVVWQHGINWPIAGNTFTISNLQSKDSIEVIQQTKYGCVSAWEKFILNVARDSVIAPLINLSPEYCYGTSPIINVVNGTGNIVRWLNTKNTLIHTGGNDTLHNLYFPDTLSLYQIEPSGCTSTDTTYIINVAKDSAIAPLINLKPLYCYGTSPVFNVTNATGSVIKWYNTKNALVYTGNNFTIPNIHITDTISLFQVQSTGCVSTEATYIFNVARDSSQMPQSDLKVGYCRGSNVVLTVTYPVSASIDWYNSKSTFIYSGNPFLISNILLNDTIFTGSVGVNGCISPLEKLIVIPTMPTSVFNATKTILNPGDATQFLNTSVGGVTYYWDFGDNSVSTDTSPWHYYNAPGLYTVFLITTDVNGCTDTLTKPAYIYVGAFAGINELFAAIGVRIFPNPFKESLTTESGSASENFKLSIMNVLGQTIYSKILVSSQTINTEAWPDGIYFLKLENRQVIGTIKLIKAK